MKKIILFLCIIMTIILTACSKAYTYPRISICPNSNNLDCTFLPLRKGYVFAEAPYSIEETENGYDIIVHCVKGEE